jgi:hypothetical protein
LNTCAEVVLFGANYDDTITYPPFFDEHILPWLNKAADKLHGRHKFLLTHTDGENRGLINSFLNCRFDIADSICPSPMTKMRHKEYRDAFKDRFTIWGGMPSIMLLKDLFPEREFKEYVDGIIDESYPYDNLILGIADTTPPDAEFDRIKYICEKTRETWSNGRTSCS